MFFGGLTYTLNKKAEKAAREASCVEKAIELMRTEPEIKKLLGEKIVPGRPTLYDGFGRLGKVHCQLKIPIKGETDNAFLYAYGRRRDENDTFRLYKAEATFAKIEGRRLILLDRTDQEDEVQVEPSAKKVEPAAKKEKKFRRLTKEEELELMKKW